MSESAPAPESIATADEPAAPDKPPPRRSRRPLVMAGLAAGVLAGAFFGFRWWQDQHNFVSTNDAQVKGDVVSVSPKIPGRLLAVRKRSGDHVTQGELVAELDPAEIKIQLQQAEANLAAARAGLRGSQTGVSLQAQQTSAQQAQARAAVQAAAANHASASDNARRLASLHADGGVSDQQMIATRSQAQAAGNAVRAADAQIAQARATIALAQSQLANTDIKSPFAGVVTKKSAEVGTMLAPMTPVVTVAATQTLEIKVPLGQASLAAVRVGQPVSFTVPTYPGRVFAGKVSEVAPTVDPRTRTTQITIRIPNQDGTLAPGMFARVTVPTAVRPNALVVDADAIVSEGEQSFVYVVTGEVARRRPVTLGLRTNEKVEVVSGVQPGERVVTLGQGQLQDGDRVQIVTNTPAGADAPASGAGHEGKK